jgi:hypothetical protein
MIAACHDFAPNFEFKAGTLMALGANKIIMGDTSELAMIDPQFLINVARGNERWHSVTAYLQVCEEYAEASRGNPTDPVALLMLDGFDAKTVRKFQKIRARIAIRSIVLEVSVCQLRLEFLDCLFCGGSKCAPYR